MSAGRENIEFNNTLALSTGGFVVFCSVLFLLERLGATAPILLWALVVIIVAIAAIFGLSGRTTGSPDYFAANHQEGMILLTYAGASGTLMAAILVLLILVPSPGLSFQLLLVLAIVIGYGLSGVIFAAPLRKSDTCSLAGFFRLHYGSKFIQVLAAIIVATVCLMLLYTEARLASLILSPLLQLSPAQVTGGILVLAAFIGLLGGASSVIRVQAALYLLAVIAILSPAIWIANNLTDIPLPQYLFGNVKVPAALLAENAQLNKEVGVAVELTKNSATMVFISVGLGFASLPHLIGRIFTASSTTSIGRSIPRSALLALLVLSAIPAFQFSSYFDGIGELGQEQAPAMPLVLQMLMSITMLIVVIFSTSALLVTIANTLSYGSGGISSVGGMQPARHIFVARILVVLVAAGVWYAVSAFSINAISMLFWALAMAAGGIFPALLASLWKSTSRFGIMAAMVGAYLFVGAGFILQETGLGPKVLNSDVVVSIWLTSPRITMIATIFSLITIYLVSLVARPAKGSGEVL